MFPYRPHEGIAREMLILIFSAVPIGFVFAVAVELVIHRGERTQGWLLDAEPPSLERATSNVQSTPQCP